MNLKVNFGLPLVSVAIQFRGQTLTLNKVLLDTGFAGTIFKRMLLEKLGLFLANCGFTEPRLTAETKEIMAMNTYGSKQTPAFPTYGHQEAGKKVLVVTAVEAEKEAVLRGLNGNTRFDVVAAGVGPVAAAVGTAVALSAAGSAYGLVVSAGIGGGFPGRADIGSLVVAEEMIAADLGAETPDGFASLDKLGFGTARVQADGSLAQRLSEALRSAGLTVQTGPVLTVSTATGTAATAAELAARIPGAAAEGMEGYGVAAAAAKFTIPALEIRAISNAVGPRDRAAWRIGDALTALEKASSILSEVVQ